MKGLSLAAVAVVWLLIATVSAALAEWPTSCVELNDLIEASRGNDENVGIYQRVHGDQAEAACRQDHGSDGFVFGGRRFMTPSRDNPAAYTQAFVERAIDRYTNEGLPATLDYYNSSQSLDGPWYVLIFDENDVLIGHAATPTLVGLHARDVLGPDGFPASLQVVANATPDGAWLSYTWVNPDSGEAQTKNSWVVRHNGLVFGSGWYEPGPVKAHPAAYTQAFVQRAIGLYDDVGRDVTFDFYGSSQSIDEQWYVFVLDEDGSTIIHPAQPQLIGTSPTTRVDINGKAFGNELVSAPEEGAWVDYWFQNPDTGTQQQKHVWAVRHDGLVFASGWYAPDKSDPAGSTQAFVSRALLRYDIEGREATIDYYNTTESVDGPWYVFIVDEAGFIIGHHNPAFRNPDPSLRVDVTGYFYGDDLLAADENGRWVSYVFLNPSTGEQETKHAWAVRHEGLLFGSGWYEP